MKKTIRVSVTQALIKRGIRGTVLDPVLLAIQAVDPRVANVTPMHARFFPTLVAVPLPEIARDFIARYDSGETPPPFAFNLEVPV